MTTGPAARAVAWGAGARAEGQVAARATSAASAAGWAVDAAWRTAAAPPVLSVRVLGGRALLLRAQFRRLLCASFALRRAQLLLVLHVPRLLHICSVDLLLERANPLVEPAAARSPGLGAPGLRDMTLAAVRQQALCSPSLFCQPITADLLACRPEAGVEHLLRLILARAAGFHEGWQRRTG